MENTSITPLSKHIDFWYNPCMLMEKPLVNRDSKSLLARCMATEDIRVIHDKTADTAYFDTQNRVLCLPIWEDMSNAMYDMLVGHEVSHALNTPSEGWQDFVGKGKGSRMRHMFINVVEDARIERLIKDKFPGLKRDFATAYSEFADRDLFELENRTIDTDMPLIDRLNLYFKIGLFGLENIPFTDEEQQYVTRMAETVTFEEVMQLAQDLYEKHQDELEDEDQDGSQSGEGSESGEGEESDQQGSQGQSGNDQGESQDGSQSGSESEDGDEDGSQSDDGDGNEDSGSVNRGGDDSGQSQDDDTDDGESADSEDGDSQETGDTSSGLEYDDYQEGTGQAGSTQNAYEQGVNNLNNTESSQWEYSTLPKMRLENCVVDYNQVRSIWDEYVSQIREDRVERYTEKRSESNVECREFLNRVKTTVANMVQQFQMKQAADADKRTEIAKTGVLDTINMINYRWSEDIFMKNEVHTDGKNHGIVMYIDWSGSMTGIIKDTVEQLVILTEFCQKVNIPFDVYAFSSRRIGEQNEDGDYIGGEQYVETDDPQVLKPHRFSLIQYLSSDMKTNEYKQAVQNLYYLAVSNNHYGYGQYPGEFGMGCTPLNEAIVSAIQMVPAFQAKHNVQIVNTVFLSDGDGHSMGASQHYRSGKSIVHDPKTRRDYAVGDEDYSAETNTYLRILQERTGSNLIGIRLYAGKGVKNLQYRYFPNDDMTVPAQSWKKNNFVAVDDQGYDKLFIVRGNLHAETDLLDGLSDDASYAKVKNAFMKGANNTKSSRVIASQMIDIIAN